MPYRRRASRGLAPYGFQQEADLLRGEDRRDPPRVAGARQLLQPGQRDAQDLAVKKEQGAQRLVVRGGGNVPLAGQHRQERLHLRRAHVARMPQPVPAHEEAHPVNVRLFSTKAIVQIPCALPHLGQQAAALWRRSGAGIHGVFILDVRTV